MDDDRVATLARLGLADPDPTVVADRTALIKLILDLGGSDDEITRAAERGSLGPLALDLSIRPAGERQRFADAATETGVALDAGARLWRSLGLPDPVAADAHLDSDEVAALALFANASAAFGPDFALALARLLGLSAARIADALVAGFRSEIEWPQMAAGNAYTDVVQTYIGIARNSLGTLTATIGTLLRRHLIARASSDWSQDPETATSRRWVTIGFADLVSYTELSATLTPDQLARLVNQFEDFVTEAVAGHGGRVVKLIGDAAMFVVDTVPDACAVALELVDYFRDRPDCAPVRVALAAGDAVAFNGDYFGTVVNLAARLMPAADPSTVIVNDAVAASAPSYSFTPLAPLAVKGFDTPQAAFVLAGGKQ